MYVRLSFSLVGHGDIHSLYIILCEKVFIYNHLYLKGPQCNRNSTPCYFYTHFIIFGLGSTLHPDLQLYLHADGAPDPCATDGGLES